MTLTQPSGAHAQPAAKLSPAIAATAAAILIVAPFAAHLLRSTGFFTSGFCLLGTVLFCFAIFNEAELVPSSTSSGL